MNMLKKNPNEVFWKQRTLRNPYRPDDSPPNLVSGKNLWVADELYRRDLKSVFNAGADYRVYAERSGRSASSVSKQRMSITGKKAPHFKEVMKIMDNQETAPALSIYGTPLQEVPHRTKQLFNGMWQPPAFLLRQEIDYSKLCRHVYIMHEVHKTSPHDLAEALGLSVTAVLDAYQVYRRWAHERGHVCDSCGFVYGFDLKKCPRCQANTFFNEEETLARED